jgi:hypothetical protein
MRDGKKASLPRTTMTSLLALLVNTYFHLFEMTVKNEEANKKKQSSRKKKSNSLKDLSSFSSLGMKSQLLSALLTGVIRAHPYLPNKDVVMEQHVDAMNWILHIASPLAFTQALMLLFQLAVGQADPPATVGNKRDSTGRCIPSSWMAKCLPNATNTFLQPPVQGDEVQFVHQARICLHQEAPALGAAPVLNHSVQIAVPVVRDHPVSPQATVQGPPWGDDV